jgi:drug/metabolite transporter (DMT)-like permease
MPETRQTLQELTTAEAPRVEPNRLKAEGMLLLTTLIWGGTFAATKALLATLPPMGLLMWRFGIGAVLFGILYMKPLREGLRSAPARAFVLPGIILGFLLYLGFGLQTIGLQFTSSGRSGFITVLYVVITPLLQTIITRRLPSARVMIGIVIVLAGLWSLTAPAGNLASLLDASGFSTFGVGDALTLICATIFAVYIIVLDRVSRDAPIAPLTAVQLFTTATLCAVHSIATEPLKVPVSAPDWGMLLFLAIFATVLTTYWQTRYQRDTTPTRAAVIFTLESVFAAILAMLFLDEKLGATGILGGALIVAGLLTVELKRGGQGNDEI